MTIYLYPPKFESHAEKTTFPIIYSFAIHNKMDLDYQTPFGDTKTFGYRTFRDYALKNGLDYNGSDVIDDWEDTSLKTSKYRADFTLVSKNKKYAIEIDSVEYHQNPLHDDKKDRYYNMQGYEVIRIPAKFALYKQHKMIEILKRETGGKHFY